MLYWSLGTRQRQRPPCVAGVPGLHPAREIPGFPGQEPTGPRPGMSSQWPGNRQRTAGSWTHAGSRMHRAASADTARHGIPSGHAAPVLLAASWLPERSWQSCTSQRSQPQLWLMVPEHGWHVPSRPFSPRLARFGEEMVLPRPSRLSGAQQQSVCPSWVADHAPGQPGLCSRPAPGPEPGKREPRATSASQAAHRREEQQRGPRCAQTGPSTFPGR